MTKLELGFYGRMPFLTPTKIKYPGTWLAASVASTLNSPALGPVTPMAFRWFWMSPYGLTTPTTTVFLKSISESQRRLMADKK